MRALSRFSPVPRRIARRSSNNPWRSAKADWISSQPLCCRRIGCTLRIFLEAASDWINSLDRQHKFQVALAALVLLFSSLELNAVTWVPFGPYGGDARAFVADPHDHTHLYLGTANGWIYESHNAGGEWKRLGRVGRRGDTVLDSIVLYPAKPNRILVGAWVLGSPDGGISVSDEGGVGWTSEVEMGGQSIRAVATAPSDSKIMVAGTLKGV